MALLLRLLCSHAQGLNQFLYSKVPNPGRSWPAIKWFSYISVDETVGVRSNDPLTGCVSNARRRDPHRAQTWAWVFGSRLNFWVGHADEYRRGKDWRAEIAVAASSPRARMHATGQLNRVTNEPRD